MSETEERHLPATQRKLRKAREEGQVARSQDFTALAALPALVWLVMDWGSFQGQIQSLMARLLAFSAELESAELLRVALAGMVEVMWISLPLLAISAVAGIVLNVIDTGGPLLSFKSITPDIQNLSPLQGFKRIFSSRAAINSGLALVKLGVFTAVMAVCGYVSFRVIMRAQLCGMPCLPDTARQLVFTLIVAATLLFVLAAIIDWLVSRALFRKEMMMSMTEMKKENKEIYGSPEFRSMRKQEGRRQVENASRLGVHKATLVLRSKGQAVALRYNPSDTPAPMIVAWASGDAAQQMIAQANDYGIPVLLNPRLAQHLAQRGRVGDYVPRDSFREVATEIIRAGG